MEEVNEALIRASEEPDKLWRLLFNEEFGKGKVVTFERLERFHAAAVQGEREWCKKHFGMKNEQT